MNCPKGNVEMIEGEAAIHASLFGIAMPATSYHKLFFHPKDGQKPTDIPVLNPDENSRGYRCPTCGGLFVERPRWFKP